MRKPKLQTVLTTKQNKNQKGKETLLGGWPEGTPRGQAGGGQHCGICPAGGSDVNCYCWCPVKTLVIVPLAQQIDSLCRHSAPSSHVLLKQMKRFGQRMLAEEVWGWKACLDKMVPALCSGREPGPSGWSQGQAKETLEEWLY